MIAPVVTEHEVKKEGARQVGGWRRYRLRDREQDDRRWQVLRANAPRPLPTFGMGDPAYEDLLLKHGFDLGTQEFMRKNDDEDRGMFYTVERALLRLKLTRNQEHALVEYVMGNLQPGTLKAQECMERLFNMPDHYLDRLFFHSGSLVLRV